MLARAHPYPGPEKFFKSPRGFLARARARKKERENSQSIIPRRSPITGREFNERAECSGMRRGVKGWKERARQETEGFEGRAGKTPGVSHEIRAFEPLGRGKALRFGSREGNVLQY